jgi:hypothetical protein
VAATHTRAGAPPSATCRSPAARRPPPWHPCRGSCRHDARATLLVKLRAYKTPPGSLLARAREYPVAAVRHCRRSVSTVSQSISLRTLELKPFPVNHNTSPSHVLIKPSHPFAGARAPAVAAGPLPSSSFLRLSSKPSDLSGTFLGSHGSSPCRTWLSPGPSLTAVELPAGAPSLSRRHRSPETPPVDPPPPIGRR